MRQEREREDEKILAPFFRVALILHLVFSANLPAMKAAKDKKRGAWDAQRVNEREKQQMSNGMIKIDTGA